MCGIAGVLNETDQGSASFAAAMRDRLVHRGPDDAGLHEDRHGRLTLTHNRLSIIDVSAGGHQPMSSDDGRFTVVFNGEIYNYVELRQELQSLGHSFQTESDTEVLLKAFRHWGKQCVDRLLGMYAFAIWDHEEQVLLLARDRVGKKPALYFWDGKTFAFASELKALLELPCCSPRLAPESVDSFLALGYIPAPQSIFRNISKLPAGHLLELKAGNLSISRYWFPERAAPTDLAPTRKGRIEQFHSIFEEAVKVRLRADVPVGEFLSGGVDSSAIAAECVRQGHALEAFTVSFDQDETDLPFARQVASHLGLSHHIVQASGGDLEQDFAQIIECYDEPFADTSNIPSYYIAKETKGHLKVVLNGDGGDEVFGGYRHYEFAALKHWLKRAGALVGKCDGSVANRWETYFMAKALYTAAERANLLESRVSASEGVSRLLRDDPYLGSYRPPNSLKMAMWADRHIYLTNDLLFKMDIALMSQGIEGRSPFLDHRLIEWAQSLPSRDLVQGRFKKVLLCDAYRGILPDSVLTRSKHGFGSPVRAWLTGPLSDLLHEHLPCPLLATEIQENAIQALSNGTPGSEYRVWTLLVFALWARRWGASWQ